jgi:DNA-binding PadR family transcriptional regulator
MIETESIVMLKERIVKSFLDLYILQLLSGNPRWGFDIIAEAKQKFGVTLSPGAIYPLLYALEESGYVTGTWDSPVRRGKKIYQITQKGQEYLNLAWKTVNLTLNELQSKPMPKTELTSAKEFAA